MTCQSFGLLCLCLCWTLVFTQQQNDVNVARGKTYSQISKFRDSDLPSQAANGNTSGDYEMPNNCIHTKIIRNSQGGYEFDNDPWWQVDLGRTYPVHRIDIWARIGLKNRLDPSIITVDNQTCASTTNFQWNSREKEVTCSSVMYGRKVRITRQGNDQPLNMCEMQIWVPSEVSECQVGRYGQGCTSTCSANCGKGQDKNFCYKNNGYCYDGCVKGWYGDQCSTRCSPGCQNTVCDRQSGQCSPCTTGYTGNKCTECQNGYFKTVSGTCERCSSNCLAQSCNSQTGRCNAGCVDGWYGEKCSSRCPTANCHKCDQDRGQCSLCTPNSFLLLPDCTVCTDGYYKRPDNTGCNLCTPNCKSGTICDKTTGYCPVCPPGKQGNFCEQECQGRKYGQDCTASCGQCRGGQTCDPITGQCSEGCQPGWTDPPSSSHNFCQSECEAGRYGQNCTQQCGHCLDTHLYGQCHPATGLCPYRCQEGWKMPLCKQEGSSETDKESLNTNAIIGSVVGSVLGGALIIGISIILGIVLKRRFVRSTETRQNNSRFNDFNMSSTPSGPGTPGEREHKSAVSRGPQNQEQPYEIPEDTAVATVAVRPEASTPSDIKYPQTEADSANPYDEMTVQYQNTGDVHLYDH